MAKELIKTDNQMLEMALDRKQAEIKYEGIIEIYPQKFLNSMVLEKLLQTLEPDYSLFKVANIIRAFKNSNSKKASNEY